MRVTFHGAAGEVTGSMHEVEAAGKRLLLDCGMVQGDRNADARNVADFPFDVSSLDALVISHAHIDHIGRVPLLVKRGFAGPIYTQTATADLMPIMLLDAASLSEQDAKHANEHRQPGEAEIQPLYTRDDVDAALRLLMPLPYDTRSTLFPGVDVVFRDAGHILGSAIVELHADDRTLVFSGDLGPKGTPILCDPATVTHADLVLMESTYGDRNHKDRAETVSELGDIFEAAWRDKGNVCIPAFAVGRSQELLYLFAMHFDDWNLSRWQIFLDSPMAAKVSGVYARHQELFDVDAQKVWKQRPDPFHMQNLRMTQTRDESMAINRIESGAIILAGSGMANGGRILHHFMQNISKPQSHIVFVGYQAEGTLGRRLVNGAPWVRIHGRDFPVKAKVHTVGGLSAHADQSGLMEWYGGFEGHPPLVLVHGEDKAREALAGEIGKRDGITVQLARPDMVLDV
jgi:metallo-beta-lactamase family protein